MFEEAEHLELSEDALGGDERLEHIWQFLERHPPAIARVCHRPKTKEKNIVVLRLFGTRDVNKTAKNYS